MRVLAVFVTISSACGSPPPAQLANVATESAASLDDLAFLTGCWGYYRIDHGFDVCWFRRPTDWKALWHTKGPKVLDGYINLEIARRGGTLELSAAPWGGTDVEWFNDVEHLALTHAAESSAQFGQGDDRIVWTLGPSRDQLRLAIGEHRPISYVLTRFAD